MKRSEHRAALRQTARELIPHLRQALETMPPEAYSAQVLTLRLSRGYMEDALEVLTRIDRGEPVDYRAICDAISLEMIANSNLWSSLRYHARNCP